MATEAEVIEKLKGDSDLRQRLAGAGSAGAARGVLSAAGIDFTDAQYEAFKARYESGEMSEEDLERVAGGGVGAWISATSGASGAVVGAIAAAAAA